MRDRLIELICENIQDECIAHCNHPYCYKCKNLADHLLANGVIVPPCKVGDKVYDIFPLGQKIIPRSVTGIMVGISTEGTYLSMERIGKDVFLTKEEAEQAIKGE